jgi:sporulation protein YlmC with PRC-barrel domain
VKKIFIRVALLLFVFTLAACDRERVEETDLPFSVEPTPVELQPTTIPEPTATAAPAGVNSGRLPDYRPMRVSELFGYEVWNIEGQDLGQVESVVLDSKSGAVEYVVMQPETGVEPADGLVPLPWEVVAPVVENDLEVVALQLTVDESVLADAPVFEAARISDIQNPDWDAGLQQYWVSHIDVLPVTGGDMISGAPLYIEDRRFTGVEFDVENLTEEDLGVVRELLISQDGQVDYALMETEEYLGLGGRVVPLPWHVLSWSQNRQRFFLNTDQEFLAGAPGFDSLENASQVSLAALDRDIAPYWEDFRTAPEENADEPPIVLQTTPVTSDQRILRATEAPVTANRRDLLDGEHVIAADGQFLGQVVDYLLGPSTAVEYVVIQSASGGEWKVVPFSAFFWHEDRNLLYFEQGSERFASAPALADPAALDPSDSNWDEEFSEYWGDIIALRLEDQDAGNEMPRQASQLIQREVMSPAGEQLGTVQEVWFGTSGRRYFVLETGGRLVPVPWENLAYEGTSRQLVFTAERQVLEAAPGFSALSDVDTSASGWDSGVISYWENGG